MWCFCLYQSVSVWSAHLSDFLLCFTLWPFFLLYITSTSVSLFLLHACTYGSTNVKTTFLCWRLHRVSIMLLWSHLAYFCTFLEYLTLLTKKAILPFLKMEKRIRHKRPVVVKRNLKAFSAVLLLWSGKTLIMVQHWCSINFFVFLINPTHKTAY